MPESNMALGLDEFRKRVADHRGYGLDPDEWDDDQEQMITFCLTDASRTFYTQANHEWSFLVPRITLAIASGVSEIELPWDFNFMVDDLTFVSDPGCKITLISDGEVFYRAQQDSSSTGRPTIAAVVTSNNPEINHGQRSKLVFYPTSGQAYTVNARYSILPNAITPQNPFPYGGAAHAQTILEGCLAASERLYGVPGLHNQLYLAALEQSKIHDRRLKPRTMGYNGNGPRRTKWAPRNVTPVVYTDL